MRLLVLLGLLFVGCTQAVSFIDLFTEEWSSWKFQHGKNYSSHIEESFRMKVYMENKYKIESHNVRYHKGEHQYALKMNRFGDLLGHEFRAMMNGYNNEMRQMSPVGSTFVTPENVAVPQSMDWRTKGAVTPVKNQGQCGSCWAFSTTGSLEGQHYRKTGKLTSLSEQQLVDCSSKNSGCGGGLMDLAFQYIKDNGGIDTEESYPYEGQDDSCHYSLKNKGAWDVGFVDIPKGDEVKLMEAVATVGPCSVAIDASHHSFQFYSHGIYHEEECDPENLDHGVLAIGYGEENGQKYWLVKNSWDVTWGDKGYIKMAKDQNNMCGIASSASYPLV